MFAFLPLPKMMKQETKFADRAAGDLLTDLLATCAMQEDEAAGKRD